MGVRVSQSGCAGVQVRVCRFLSLGVQVSESGCASFSVWVSESVCAGVSVRAHYAVRAHYHTLLAGVVGSRCRFLRYAAGLCFIVARSRCKYAHSAAVGQDQGCGVRGEWRGR
jgi:hypothetical protein